MNRPTVLVIDDEQTYLQVITDTLAEKGYKILQAINGRMGCMVAQKYIPDIIITDWEMPEMNGIETTIELKKDPLTQYIPVIMCTGIMTTSQNLEKALSAGASDFIRKPIDPLELVARINSALTLSNSIKQIKMQNNELQKLIATKDKFFGIIAHDLKNPFNSIIGITDLLVNSEEEYSPEQIHELIEMVRMSAKNSYKLLENLLEWAKAQTGQIEIKLQAISAKDLFNENIIQNFSLAAAKGISVTSYCEEKLMLLADINIVNTVLRNLITNAIKYTPRGGNVILSAEDKYNGIVEISVKDTGTGLTADVIEKLFKINHKVSSLGTENEPGTGLGLILCKELIEKHGGVIWVQSMPGEGSDFKFTLPKAAKQLELK